MRTVRDRWYFSFALVPVLIGLLFLSLVLYWRDRDTAQENMRQTVKAMSLVVDSEITHALNFALAFAASTEELESGDIAALHRKALESLEAGNMADAMVLIDETGQQIFNTLLPADAPLPRTNNMEEVRQLFAIPKPGISLEGVHITAAYARSDKTGYGVAIGVPNALLMERMRSELTMPMVGVLAAVLLSLGLAWRFDLVLRQHRKDQAAVREGQRRLYDMLETLPVYVALLDANRRIAFANRLFRDRFGAHNDSGFNALSSRNEHVDFAKAAGADDTSIHQWDWQAPDGNHYAVYDRPFTDTEGRSLILEMGIDVTRQRQAELEQARLNRALRLVSECNSVLVYVKEETPLVDAICNLVVETGGYLMAWIGIAENDADKHIRPVAQSGFEDGYLGGIRVSRGDDELGRGPTGVAVRTRTIQVNQNYLTNPAMAPWRRG